ncbi:MAG TPA: DUF86 domain-containing protein [Candidatus Deferrimicrobiaceae bacterium]
MVDKYLILRKVAELDRYIVEMGEYSTIEVGAYRADWKVQRIVERTLQMMIETCADIANHVISDECMRVPTGYADTFRVLSENGVISPDLSSVMEKMAKFRNIVVHQYESVDAEIVVLVLRKHLGDFGEFRGAILKHLPD